VKRRRSLNCRALDKVGGEMLSGMPAAPDFIPFQLAKLVRASPPGPRWVHEIRFDGYRMQLHVERGQARCLTRNGLDWTNKFPVLAAVAGELRDCILDGELCAMAENGYSDFPALRSAIARRQTDGLVFWAFDLLHLAGRGDLRGETLQVRKGALQAMLQGREEVVRRFIRWVEPFGG
jgi:bifunctional non-homologous end joining protein LigD